MKKRDLVGIVLAVVVAATCVRLGFWQLSRLHQRRARNAIAFRVRSLPPLDLTKAVGAEPLVDRRVHLRGTYDYSQERFWRPRTMDDMPGVDLVTPVRLPDGTAVFVDRGFVPSPDAYHVDQQALREPEQADVVGLAVRAPRGHGDVDPHSLADSLPYRVLPFIVQALPEEGNAAARLAPRRLPAPELSDGPHLSYAIQWFCFATIVVVGTTALIRKEYAERATANASR